MRRLGVTFAVVVLVLSCVLASMKIALPEGSGGQIDLFTQKEPYSGKGSNMPSDAFGPGEEVRIYASVTYNDYRVAGILVAFAVFGPRNPTGNITFYRTAVTDEDGIAMMTFRVSYLNETTFGSWTIDGNADIAGVIIQDSVSFRVGWIVEIVSIRTVNDLHVAQDRFTPNSSVGVELVLKSISMVEKSTTISLVLNDSLGIRVSAAETNGFVVPPNEVPIYFYCFLYIPERAFVGTASISANSYTKPVSQDGVPYCPEVLTYFLITTRDVAILSVKPDVQYVHKGEIVNVDVCVKNKGRETESFNARAFYNGTLIGILPISDLKPSSNVTLTFVWNTGNVEQGTYMISASADAVPGEIYLSDNTYNDGFVDVTSYFHDIAVMNVIPSDTSVQIGAVVDVQVIVKNLGSFTESFNVTLFYDSTAIETLPVGNLTASTEQTLIFHWNTQGVSVGNHTLRASASQVFGETNLDNNVYVDGSVEVKAIVPSPIMYHDVATINVVPSSTLVFIGQTIEISATVKNQGNYTETFSVTAYYDSNVIGTLLVTDLERGAEKSLVFYWNTWNVSKGNYAVSAFAGIVLGDVDSENNRYTDGVVKVTQSPSGWFTLEWWHLLLLLLLILIIILLIILLYRRRRKKKQAQASFKSGWVAWYYGYDIINRKSQNLGSG